MRLATKRGTDSETGVPRVEDNETGVPRAMSIVPEIMRLRSAVAMDRVSETAVHCRNTSTGSNEFRSDSLHIPAVE